MYVACASSFAVPLSLSYASHFALPFGSNIPICIRQRHCSKPGRSVELSPTMDCLNRAYSSSRMSFEGLVVRDLTSEAALMNSAFPVSSALIVLWEKSNREREREARSRIRKKGSYEGTQRIEPRKTCGYIRRAVLQRW
jgi:hypothetical protein